MTVKEVYESVTQGGSTDFAEAAAILNIAGPWCLIGGLAVNCFVDPVLTVDADIVFASENRPRVRDTFSAAGFQLEAFPHSLYAIKPKSKLRIQFTHDLRYQEFIKRATQREVLGIMVPVAKLEDIIQGKLWAWQDSERRPTKRKKDELDLMRIGEAFPELRKVIPTEIISQLKGGS